MDRQAIIQKVQLKLDEITPYDSGEIINNPFVDELLDDSVKTLLLKLPVYICPQDNIGVSTGIDNGDGTGYVVLPSDFIRLISFKMEEWSRAITTPITEDNPLYNLQKNPYLRGKPNKPVVVIFNDISESSVDVKILEYYSVSSSHAIDKALYVKSDVAENLPDAIIDPLAYQCAADAFMIMEQPELAQLALGKVNEFITLNSY